MITAEEIQNDIAGFQERVATARAKLNDLPQGYLPYLEHKKRKAKRKELKDEIQHVQRLIGYAEEALTECRN